MPYLKLNNEPKDLTELINSLYSFSPEYSNTIFTQRTYIDKECTELECNAGKSRSFDDIFNIAKTYFPNTTEKELLEVLLELKPLNYYNNQTKIFIANCDSIKKPTISYCKSGGVYHKEDDNKMYNSDYRWSSLLRLVSLTYNDLDAVGEF